jgi:sec-independent protein translocase protein TatA
MPVLIGMPGLGVPELLIILAVVVIVFGVGRLPEVGGALGKSIREFRRSTRDDDEGKDVASTVEAPETDASREAGAKPSGKASASRRQH